MVLSSWNGDTGNITGWTHIIGIVTEGILPHMPTIHDHIQLPVTNPWSSWPSITIFLSCYVWELYYYYFEEREIRQVDSHMHYIGPIQAAIYHALQ